MKQLTMRATPLLVVVLLFGLGLSAGTAFTAEKPNIVVIWGDDPGRSIISAYTHGLMGYRTPNIDRIANEGMMFTDYLKPANYQRNMGRSYKDIIDTKTGKPLDKSTYDKMVKDDPNHYASAIVQNIIIGK
jgi:hypothetical protein